VCAHIQLCVCHAVWHVWVYVCVHRCVWVRVWGVHGVWEEVRGVGEKEECNISIPLMHPPPPTGYTQQVPQVTEATTRGAQFPFSNFDYLL